jgi:hypothetical protein
MFADLNILEPVLKMNPNQSNSWRTSPEYYRPVINGLRPGSLNISPAWFEQGHEVRVFSLFYYRSSWSDCVVGATPPESVGSSQEREPYLRVVKEEPIGFCADWRDLQHYPSLVV